MGPLVPASTRTNIYIFRDGRMHNGLTVVTFQLTDVPPGVGGLIVIPGSHKSNYPCPQKDAALSGTSGSTSGSLSATQAM